MINNLREHQLMMLEMLSEVDRICKKYKIAYMLFAGTMLGAVRHKGFIPWDDDLDIVMLRDEYERFLELAEKELDPNTYYLQREFSSHWPMFFSKLRRNGTACIERYIPKDNKTHLGIYIDIFPCDNLYENQVMRRLQFGASKIIIAKALGKRGYITNNLVKKFFIIFSRLIPAHFLINFVQYKNGKGSNMVHTFFGASSKYSKNIYPRKWFLHTCPVLFERKLFPISLKYDEMLTQLYDDYMVPIPENKRGKKIHGEIVDLAHSYTLYTGIQKKMKFHEYTRSIR